MTAVLIKTLIILIITAGLSLAVGSQKPEYAFLISLSGGVVALLLVLDAVLPAVSQVKAVFMKASGTVSFLLLPLKALGIAYITDFAADTCRDFGQSALASKAELAGKCAIFILCVPSVVSVLQTAFKFAGL